MSEWWVMQLWEVSPAFLVSWIVWVLGSVTLHELAHGWQAIRSGDDTPVLSGHMTWNPLVHMGPVSLIVFALCGIAWGLMPVNPSRFRRSTDDALVALAGPAMNFWLAVGALFGGVAWTALTTEGHWGVFQVNDTVALNVMLFFAAGATLNILLMILNLIPVPPLDGSRILATFSPRYRRLWESNGGQFAAIVAFAIVFFWISDVIMMFGLNTYLRAHAHLLNIIAMMN